MTRMGNKLRAVTVDLEQDTAEERYFEEQVEVFADNVCELHLVKLQKVPQLDSKRLFFINNGLNIMCATKRLKDFSFVRLNNLKERLNFNFNLSDWKMQGPDEKLPTIKTPFGDGHKIDEHEDRINLESVLRNPSRPAQEPSQHLQIPETSQLKDSVVDENQFQSVEGRMHQINLMNENLKSKFKLSENKRKNQSGVKESSNILDMHLKNNDINGFSGFKITE